MALGSRQSKKPTMAEVIRRAGEQDAARQEQISNQANIINRLLEINQTYESVLEEIASNQPRNRNIAHDLATDALNMVADINKKHREQEGSKEDGE